MRAATSRTLTDWQKSYYRTNVSRCMLPFPLVPQCGCVEAYAAVWLYVEAVCEEHFTILHPMAEQIFGHFLRSLITTSYHHLLTAHHRSSLAAHSSLLMLPHPCSFDLLSPLSAHRSVLSAHKAQHSPITAQTTHHLTLTTRFQRVVLEQLPLVEQMSLFSRSTVLIAVHGQAMAWVMFLGKGDERGPSRAAAGKGGGTSAAPPNLAGRRSM